MHAVVLGSGVIGTSIAWHLARAGHEVTVVERQPASGLETSYGNAGEISPGLSAPWAAPGIPMKAIKWLLMQHSPLAIRPSLDPALWRWGFAMLANCNARSYEVNKARMVRVAEYSRDCLRELRVETGLRYDERSRGTLQLFRTERQVDGSAADIAVLERMGVPYQTLDRAGCLDYEPALARVQEKFVGGLRLPGDETGDCFKFTQALAVLAAQRGVRFLYDTAIESIEVEGGRVARVRTSRGEVQGDAYVLALGSYSPQLAAPLGLRLPVYPVKGYSITVPITDAAAAPESTVMDETYKVAVTRLGDRIRVGGTAELAGYSTVLRAGRRHTLEFVVNDLFPGGGDTARAEFWTGLRPMTPDGTPILGRGRQDNLWLATGHGTLGWTMSAGTGRLMADLLSGRKPAIDMEGLGVERYGASARL
jgi:D-amino-acid dehydrogenase